MNCFNMYEYHAHLDEPHSVGIVIFLLTTPILLPFWDLQPIYCQHHLDLHSVTHCDWVQACPVDLVNKIFLVMSPERRPQELKLWNKFIDTFCQWLTNQQTSKALCTVHTVIELQAPDLLTCRGQHVPPPQLCHTLHLYTPEAWHSTSALVNSNIGLTLIEMYAIILCKNKMVVQVFQPTFDLFNTGGTSSAGLK